MADTPDLRALLSAAASDGIATERHCAPLDAEAALRFLLAQIATTMLGRCLTITIGTTRIEADVVGRRLLRLRCISGAPALHGSDAPALQGSDAPALQGLSGENLRPDATEALLTLSEALKALCATARDIRVTSRPLPAGGPAAQGLAVAQLAVALDLPPTPEPGDPVDAFLDALGEGLICAALISDEALEPLEGSGADIELLSERIAHWLPPDALTQAEILGPEGVLHLGSAAQGPSLVAAACGDHQITALVTPAAGSHLLRCGSAARQAL